MAQQKHPHHPSTDSEKEKHTHKIETSAEDQDFDQEHIFALPSESDHNLASNFVDGKNDLKIIHKNTKINTENSSSTVSLEDHNSRPKSFIGRKGRANWSRSVATLRKKFGFSWQKLSRSAAVFILIFGILSLVLVTSVAAIAIDYYQKTPSISQIDRQPNQNSVLYARDGKTKIYEFYKEEKRAVIDKLDDIPRIMQLAMISLEDETFFDQNNDTGIPWRNIAGATLKCFISAGDECRGGSGISQQFVKNLTSEDQQTLDRKIRELFTAVKMNRQSTKEDILLKYLNWVSFGRNSYGVQEASKAYFGRPVTEKDEAGNFKLSAPEACYIASMVQKPGFYPGGVDKIGDANALKQKNSTQENNSSASTASTNDDGTTAVQEVVPDTSIQLEARKDACLDKLRQLKLPIEQVDENGKKVLDANGKPVIMEGNYIKTDEELKTLINQPVISTKSQEEGAAARAAGKIAFVTLPVDDPYPHFREFITQELTDRGILSDTDLYETGYDIVTTLDPDIQNNIDRIIKEGEPSVRAVGGDNAASMVLDGKSGQILAMVGSFGYNREDIDGKVNIATTAQQPGSSIKPYVYAAAFKNGFNPGTVLNDVATNWSGYTPKNFDGRFRGPVTMRRALQGSLNIPAVKAMFLNNDNGPSNVDSKLDTFFDFAEARGVRFPCVSGASNEAFSEKTGGTEICNVDESRNVTQNDVDKAYRGRCFLATALGGCELTMVSHITGINSLLHAGDLKTSTPFISIKNKRTGEDVYAKKQATEKPPYPQIIATPEDKLVAEQTALVMTDTQARIPEFGSTRFSLQMADNRPLAVKTGTSNGPRDFWTIGGSPQYTAAVWGGRNDNKPMDPNASSGAVVANIWRKMMEYLNAGKPVEQFPADGLQRAGVGEGSELLTPKQIESLKTKGGRVAINSPQDLEAFRKKDIFVNRTAQIPISYATNSLDGGLFVDGKTLESNKKVVECTILVAEFPIEAWKKGVDDYLAKTPTACKIPEPSTQDQVGQSGLAPIFISNISNGTIISSINVSASFTASSGKFVSKLSILVDGNEVDSVDGTSLTYSIPNSKYGETHNITFKVLDTLGNTYNSTTFNNVQYVAPGGPLLPGDVSVSCPASAAKTSTTNCTILINDTSKTFSTIKLQIGNAAESGVCSIPGGVNGTCVVPTPTLPVGSNTIKLRIDAGGQTTLASTINIT